MTELAVQIPIHDQAVQMYCNCRGNLDGLTVSEREFINLYVSIEERLALHDQWVIPVVPAPAVRLEVPELQPADYHAPNLPFREWKIIVNGTRLQDQTAIAQDALADVNEPPFVFNRARSLVRVAFDEHGDPSIVPLNEAALRGILERCAVFVRQWKDGTDTPIAPPIEVVRDLAALPEWHLIPPISGIVECPIILPDGSIVTKRGYDPGTHLYYAPTPGFTLPDIPERPTDDDVEAAVALLQEVFEDFPFVDMASRTNTIAALIATVIRPMIKGLIPLALIDKPQAGTGASLIAEVIALLATGRSGAIMAAPENDAAWRKMITSTLFRGRTVAIVDNIESKLYVPSLAALLTAKVWTDRILGQLAMTTLPHRLVWLATGNNIQLGGDLPRRCYWIRMDAQTARPWQRTGFRHPDLLPWVDRERGRIVAAILTMTRSWILAGRPGPGEKVPIVGGFEEWRDTIGSILNYCNLPDFLGNMDEMYLMVDADTPQWETFFEKWYTIWPETGVTVAELAKHMQNESASSSIEYSGTDRLVDLLPDRLVDAWNGKKNFARAMGKVLSHLNGRIFINDLYLKKGDVSHHAIAWQVKKRIPLTGTGELEKKPKSDVKGEFRGVYLTYPAREKKNNISYERGVKQTPSNSPPDVKTQKVNSPVPTGENDIMDGKGAI